MASGSYFFENNISCEFLNSSNASFYGSLTTSTPIVFDGNAVELHANTLTVQNDATMGNLIVTGNSTIDLGTLDNVVTQTLNVSNSLNVSDAATIDNSTIGNLSITSSLVCSGDLNFGSNSSFTANTTTVTGTANAQVANVPTLNLTNQLNVMVNNIVNSILNSLGTTTPVAAVMSSQTQELMECTGNECFIFPSLTTNANPALAINDSSNQRLLTISNGESESQTSINGNAGFINISDLLQLENSQLLFANLLLNGLQAAIPTFSPQTPLICIGSPTNSANFAQSAIGAEALQWIVDYNNTLVGPNALAVNEYNSQYKNTALLHYEANVPITLVTTNANRSGCRLTDTQTLLIYGSGAVNLSDNEVAIQSPTTLVSDNCEAQGNFLIGNNLSYQILSINDPVVIDTVNTTQLNAGSVTIADGTYNTVINNITVYSKTLAFDETTVYRFSAAPIVTNRPGKLRMVFFVFNNNGYTLYEMDVWLYVQTTLNQGGETTTSELTPRSQTIELLNTFLYMAYDDQTTSKDRYWVDQSRGVQVMFNQNDRATNTEYDRNPNNNAPYYFTKGYGYIVNFNASDDIGELEIFCYQENDDPGQFYFSMEPKQTSEINATMNVQLFPLSNVVIGGI